MSALTLGPFSQKRPNFSQKRPEAWIEVIIVEEETGTQKRFAFHFLHELAVYFYFLFFILFLLVLRSFVRGLTRSQGC
jgi:hypothetical protein